MTKENLEAADNELSSSNVDDVPERPNFEYYKPFGATALGSSVTPKTPNVRPLVDPNLPPEIGQFLEKYADAETAEEEFSTFETITGYGAGMATEVGTFVTLTSALAKWNKASMMGPGALRNLTPVGLGTTAFIEGLSAYGANYAQQMYLKAYGLDKSENINAGELVASTLLGPSQVAERVEEGVTGAFKYILKNESFDKLKAWKGGQFLTKEGTGRFITGASLGLAESAIRQEIESLLNGTERNVYDYLISAGAGGGMQYSLFKLWGETGKWGRDQAAAAFGKSRKRLEDRKSELLQELKESQQTGNKYKKKGASIRITKEIEKVEQAQSVIDEASESVVKANDAATKREQELSKDVDPIEEPVAPVEAEVEVEAPKGVAPVITPDKPEQPILPPLNVDEPQPITTTDAPQKRDRFVDDVREDKLDELESRIQNIGVTPEGGTLPTEGPKVHRDGKKLADETALKVEGLVRVLAKNTEDIDKNVAQELLKEIKFTRRLNKNVIDWFNTTGARLLQSQKKDAQIYEWEGRYSERAQLQDEALSRLEATLEAKTRGLIDGDEADIQKMFDDYVGTPEKLKAKAKKEIKARKEAEVSEAVKAEQLRKAYENKRTKLEKELKQLRNRFAAIDKEEAAAGLKPKKRKKDPRLKELEEKVKFYKEAEKEVKLVTDLEAELARVADIEGRSIIGEVRAEITPAPKGPTKPLKSQILKKKIAESKTRMRQKIADLDRARKEIEDAQLTARLFKEIEESFHKQLETDVSSMITRGWRWVQSMRQQSLINQLPSAMAGLPTGLGGIVKQFFRPVGNFIYNKDNVALPVRTRLALADAAGALRTIHLTKDLWVEARRTFAENASAIDRRAGRLSDEMSISAAPRGTHAVVVRAYTSAKRRAEAVENVSNAFTRFFKYGDIFKVMSLGVRGIQSVDSVFKRMLKRGRQHSLAQKKAILEFPNDPAKAQQRALEIYKAQWRDSDGLDVLNDTTDFDFEMSQIDEELLFAADGDLADMPVDPVENFIKRAKDQVNDGGWLGASIDAFAVYIGVPIRSIYRGGKYTLKPAQLVAQGSLAKVPGLRGQINPFSKKVKEFELLIRGEYEILRRTDDPEKIKGARDRIEGLTERRNLAAERRLKYNEELITDAMVASSLMMVGGATALYYGGTGSLEWLTPEQRKNNKLESFKMFGSDYSAAMPWAFPLALSADVASWFRIKAEERATGKTILTKEQTLSYVIGSSFKKLAEAMPLAQGIETAQDIAAFEGDVTKNAISRLLASYIPIPAQLRKINNTINQEGIPDLRGGSYWDRVAYSVVGSGVTNLKTDRLGEDEQNTANWITQNIIRQAPRDELIRTEFDKVVATDTHGNLTNKPSMLATGIKMTEWVNEDGMTLSYAFDQKLKKKVLPVTQLKGYRYTIKQAVGALIKDAAWVRKYNKGFQIDPESGRFVNEGLAELNTVMNKFYNETKKDILKDDQFTNTFVNEDDESLYYLLRTRGLKPEPGGRPLSPLEILIPKQ